MTKYFKTMRESLQEARQFRDPKVDLKVVKNNKVIVIDKSDWPTYKAKGWMQAESTQVNDDLTEFTSAQMTKLKKEYEPLKGKRLPVGAVDKMNTMLKKYSTDMLMKLAKGDIPFLSTAAKSELVINRGKKWTDFKEPLDMAEADELQCEACWTGFKQVGMKTKGGKQVPNCVPEEKLFEDPDCPTCNGGECQCATPEVGKVHECCGNEECICDSLEEALKVKYDKTKQGWFDDKGRRRYLGNAATNAIMKKKLDHAIKTGDWTSFDVSKEEIEFNFLEEKFTKKDFKNNENDNEHGLNAKKVVDMFGTSAEKMKIDAINARHNMKGHISREDQRTRDSLVSKYYNKLKENLEENKITKAKEIAKKMKFTDFKLNMSETDEFGPEADLTKTQIKMVHKKADDLPKNDFIKRYGKDGDSVRFATATNMVKKKLGVAENLIKGENEMNESYKDNFNAAMEELGINSLDELESVEEQKAFFSYVDSLEEGLTAGQKKLPPALQKAILKKQGETKDDKKEAVSPAQQAAIAISKKEKGEEPKKEMKMKKEETEDVAEMAEMSPMKKEMIKAMTDPKKMNAMTMQDPKQDMIKKHSNDDIKAMKKMEMDMAKNNDDTETPSMEMMKAMMMPKKEMMKKEMMKKDEMAKKMEMMKRVNSMKDANPMYAMKMNAGKEMMKAMKKVKQGENKKINAMYGEKYLPTREGSLEAAVLKSVSTKKTD